MLKSFIPASFVLSAILVAACGGDDGSVRLSKADFIAEADPICHEAVANIRAIAEPTSDEEAKAAFAELKGIIDGMLDDLRDLRPPAEDEDVLEEMYDKMDRLVTIWAPSLDVASADAAAEFERLEAESTQLEADIREIAETYGFESCGLEDE